MLKGLKRKTENRSQLLFGFCLIVIFILLLGCTTQEVEPVAIAAEDMCNYCRMAISDKRFAVEFISSDGQPLKFDDISCMGNFIREKGNRQQIAAFFVTDFETRQWLKAENAFYVSSSELHSPMGGNTVAFSAENKARAAGEKFNGKLVTFNDLLSR